MNSNQDEAEDNETEWTQEAFDQLQIDLNTIERILENHLEKLEDGASGNLLEEIPLEELPSSWNPFLQATGRIISGLKRCSLAEDTISRENASLKKQLNEQRSLLEEVILERDVLLQQVHAYLETNSSLRIRLEEQRCQSGAVQATADLELRIKTLENEKEKLTDSNMEKDKQIHKMAIMLEQTAKCLKNRETEFLNRKNEENNLMKLLKTDLRKALEEKSDAEEKYSCLKQRLEEHFCGGDALGALRNSLLKRSLSVGDVSARKPGFRDEGPLPGPPGASRRSFETFEESGCLCAAPPVGVSV